MRVDWALVCRYGEQNQDGTATLVGAGIDALWLAEVPSDVGIFLMLRLAGQPDEFQEAAHQFGINLIDPESDERDLLSFEFGPMPGPPPLAQPGLDVGMLLPAQVQWQADHFGLYTLELLIDGRRQRSIAITIRDTSTLEGEAENG